MVFPEEALGRENAARTLPTLKPHAIEQQALPSLLDLIGNSKAPDEYWQGVSVLTETTVSTVPATQLLSPLAHRMSSLFGNLGSQPPKSSGPSLFSGLGASTTSSAQTAPSLFSGLGGATATSGHAAPTLLNPAPAKKPLFGSLGASTPTLQPPQPTTTTPGLFGDLGASKPAQSGGLFGTSQPQQQASSGGGLFGGLGAGQHPQSSVGGSTLGGVGSGSMFGALGGSTMAPSAGAGNSLFGATTSQPQQQSQAQTEPAKASAAYFDQMLERGRKRNAQGNGLLGGLPTLQLGLGDIARKVRNLGTGGPTAEQGQAGNGARNGAGDSRA
jgi:nuclear pore complex protein Nup93